LALPFVPGALRHASAHLAGSVGTSPPFSFPSADAQSARVETSKSRHVPDIFSEARPEYSAVKAFPSPKIAPAQFSLRCLRACIRTASPARTVHQPLQMASNPCAEYFQSAQFPESPRRPPSFQCKAVLVILPHAPSH